MLHILYVFLYLCNHKYTFKCLVMRGDCVRKRTQDDKDDPFCIFTFIPVFASFLPLAHKRWRRPPWTYHWWMFLARFHLFGSHSRTITDHRFLRSSWTTTLRWISVWLCKGSWIVKTLSLGGSRNCGWFQPGFVSTNHHQGLDECNPR